MKNVITTLALLAASSALASAATTTVDLVSIAGTTAQILGSSGIGSGTGVSGGTTLGASSSGTYVDVSASDVGTYIGGNITASTFLYGSGTLNANSTATLSVAPTITDGTVSFSIFSRVASWYGGWAALVISVDDILSQNSDATIDDLTTVSYAFSASGSGAELTAWVVSGTTATELTVGDNTIDVSSATAGSYIVLLVSNYTASSTTAVTLSATTTIPEPSAYGLLAGVGALALVAARRRRSRKA